MTAFGAAAFSAHARQPRREFDPGVTVRLYQLSGDVASIPDLEENQTPNVDQLFPTINIDNSAFDAIKAPKAPFSTKIIGLIDLPGGDPGPGEPEYRFRLTSDDGSRLMIDGKVVVKHDGRHGSTSKESEPIMLAAGRHDLVIDHFDSGGSRMVKLEWRPPGETSWVLVPTSRLLTEADPTRVTSPGVKKIKDPDPRRPGDGRPLAGVHPGFDLATISIDGFEPRVGGMCFDSKGRLIVGTFDPLQRDDTALPDIESKTPDKLYAITGLAADVSGAKVVAVADGLFEPCGLCAVGDAIYVSQRREITRLLDKDGDGFYETHETVGNGWEGWNYHQFDFGLVYKDGKLYSTLATAMAPPPWEGMGTNAAPNGPMRGCVIETDLSSNTSSVIAGGCRTPNGIGVGPGGALFYCDNQGTWMCTSQMAEVVPGRFFGHYNNTNFVPKLAERFPNGGTASALSDHGRAPAALFLPQNEFSNSPTQPILIHEGPYKGQMLIGELTAGGLRRAFMEKVNGEWQGAAFRFTQGLNCGVNRVAWAADGSLYMGGIGANGNWNWNGKKFGLQRLTPNGKTAFEMLAMRATPTGFEVEFTRPVDPARLADPKSYTLSQWTYTPTVEYGGPKVDEEKLSVTKAEPSSDGTRVTLTIPGLKTGYCIHLRTDPKSKSGELMWSTDAYYTLNSIPRAEALKASALGGKPVVPQDVGVGAMTPKEGAVLIGRSARNSFMTPPEVGVMPKEGRTQKDLLAQPAYVEMTEGSGDLTSRTSFGDARLHVEWYCPPGGEGQMAGNSGVYLQSLYEVQVLGTKAGAEPKKNEAGAVYTQKAPDVNASTGPGTWQAYDIWFRAPRFKDG